MCREIRELSPQEEQDLRLGRPIFWPFGEDETHESLERRIAKIEASFNLPLDWREHCDVAGGGLAIWSPDRLGDFRPPKGQLPLPGLLG